jgi:hypothetical protein
MVGVKGIGPFTTAVSAQPQQPDGLTPIDGVTYGIRTRIVTGPQPVA